MLRGISTVSIARIEKMFQPLVRIISRKEQCYVTNKSSKLESISELDWWGLTYFSELKHLRVKESPTVSSRNYHWICCSPACWSFWGWPRPTPTRGTSVISVLTGSAGIISTVTSSCLPAGRRPGRGRCAGRTGRSTPSTLSQSVWSGEKHRVGRLSYIWHIIYII